MVWPRLLAVPLPYRQDGSEGLSLGAGLRESMGMGVEEPAVSSYSVDMPSTKMRVRPRGNVGWLPNHSSTSNLICFLGFSSAGVGVSSCCALVLGSQGLGCKLRCSM